MRGEPKEEREKKYLPLRNLETYQKEKVNKTAEPGEINKDHIKAGGQKLKKRLYNLITKVWNQGKLTSEWRL